jgi:hypothetical protein
MGVIGPPILAIIFIGWVLYRTLITKDIRKYKNEVFGGFFFIAVWVLIYVVIT